MGYGEFDIAFNTGSCKVPKKEIEETIARMQNVYFQRFCKGRSIEIMNRY
jgi:hypothetical protein